MENRWLFFNDFKNTKLKRTDGESAGSIADVVLDLQTGGVVLYTLNRGGFLGTGGQQLALPPDSLQFSKEETQLLASEEAMEQAPGSRTDWPKNFDSSFIDEVYRHYGYKTLS